MNRNAGIVSIGKQFQTFRLGSGSSIYSDIDVRGFD